MLISVRRPNATRSRDGAQARYRFRRRRLPSRAIHLAMIARLRKTRRRTALDWQQALAGLTAPMAGTICVCCCSLALAYVLVSLGGLRNRPFERTPHESQAQNPHPDRLTGGGFRPSAGGAWCANSARESSRVGAASRRETGPFTTRRRTLQPILREIALSRQLRQFKQIRGVGRKPDDPVLTRRAICGDEAFRLNFAGSQLLRRPAGQRPLLLQQRREQIRGTAATATPWIRRRPKDRWFYDIVKQRREMHINVNPDANLGVATVDRCAAARRRISSAWPEPAWILPLHS